MKKKGFLHIESVAVRNQSVLQKKNVGGVVAAYLECVAGYCAEPTRL